jgi:hypothetical protein
MDRLSISDVELALLSSVEFVACPLAAIKKLLDIVRASTVANIRGMILCLFVTIEVKVPQKQKRIKEYRKNLKERGALRK